MKMMSKTDVACADCPIRHNAVCAQCESDELEVLERIKSYTTAESGETLFRATDRMTHFCSVVEGAATMSRTLPDGRRQMVGLLLPGDFIGRPGRTDYPFDIEAISRVTLCRFERARFERLIADTPRVSARLLQMTLDELDAARDWAVVLGRLTAREKVASFLVSLARRMAHLNGGGARPGAKVIIDLPLSRDEMADHLGLTIETTSRQISALKRDGLIVTDGARRIEIPDFDALVDEAGDDEDGGTLA
ncbi:transcriptional regulator FnrL [Aestuariibius sp. 2305UL40-4]|uniref:transcriptional regulator FnrL n=1 Tax=Aestuariibius violaceus TaxID=3234132 RepID=UPI00398E9412